MKKKNKIKVVLLTAIESLKQTLTNNFDIFHWDFHNLLLHFIVQINAMFSARNIISEVIPTKILLQVIQSIEEIGCLPCKIFYN